MEQLFERNLQEATEKVESIIGTFVSGRFILDELFLGKVADIIYEYIPNNEKKNAIVLLGQSFSGKTYFANKFIKEHPDFSIASMDLCALEEMSKIDEIDFLKRFLQDDGLMQAIGNKSFGKILTEGNNIIVDGCWLHLNIRSALLKTLNELGYHVCIFSFINIPMETLYIYVRERVFQNIAQSYLNFDAIRYPYLTDFVKIYAETFGITIPMARQRLLNSQSYKPAFEEALNYLLNEAESSMAEEQAENGWFTLGADEYLNLF